MLNSVLHYAQKISDNAHYLVYGYEVKATPENLRWALAQRQEDILKYKFKDSFQTYTIIEFAVKCGDYSSTCTLVELGANLGFSAASGTGTLLHFYMDCLEENTAPNLDLLHLLIDKIDINIEEGGWFCTSLERAVTKMAHFKKVHWDVVEILLKRGSRITVNEYTRSSPFMILEDCDFHRIKHGRMIRSAEEEITFLRNLSTYAELQRKYHPLSDCSLTLEAFNFHTSNLHDLVTHIAITMSTFAFFSDSVDSFAESLEEPGFFEEKSVVSNEKETTEFKQSVQQTQIDCSLQLNRESSKIGCAFIVYNKFFQVLVKERKFTECFATWKLTSILPVFKKHPSFETRSALDLLEGSQQS